MLLQGERLKDFSAQQHQLQWSCSSSEISITSVMSGKVQVISPQSVIEPQSTLNSLLKSALVERHVEAKISAPISNSQVQTMILSDGSSLSDEPCKLDGETTITSLIKSQLSKLPNGESQSQQSTDEDVEIVEVHGDDLAMDDSVMTDSVISDQENSRERQQPVCLVPASKLTQDFGASCNLPGEFSTSISALCGAEDHTRTNTTGSTEMMQAAAVVASAAVAATQPFIRAQSDVDHRMSQILAQLSSLKVQPDIEPENLLRRQIAALQSQINRLTQNQIKQSKGRNIVSNPHPLQSKPRNIPTDRIVSFESLHDAHLSLQESPLDLPTPRTQQPLPQKPAPTVLPTALGSGGHMFGRLKVEKKYKQPEKSGAVDKKLMPKKLSAYGRTPQKTEIKETCFSGLKRFDKNKMIATKAKKVGGKMDGKPHKVDGKHSTVSTDVGMQKLLISEEPTKMKGEKLIAPALLDQASQTQSSQTRAEGQKGQEIIAAQLADLGGLRRDMSEQTNGQKETKPIETATLQRYMEYPDVVGVKPYPTVADALRSVDAVDLSDARNLLDTVCQQRQSIDRNLARLRHRHATAELLRYPPEGLSALKIRQQVTHAIKAIDNQKEKKPQRRLPFAQITAGQPKPVVKPARQLHRERLQFDIHSIPSKLPLNEAPQAEYFMSNLKVPTVRNVVPSARVDGRVTKPKVVSTKSFACASFSHPVAEQRQQKQQSMPERMRAKTSHAPSPEKTGDRIVLANGSLVPLAEPLAQPRQASSIAPVVLSRQHVNLDVPVVLQNQSHQVDMSPHMADKSTEVLLMPSKIVEPIPLPPQPAPPPPLSQVAQPIVQPIFNIPAAVPQPQTDFGSFERELLLRLATQQSKQEQPPVATPILVTEVTQTTPRTPSAASVFSPGLPSPIQSSPVPSPRREVIATQTSQPDDPSMRSLPSSVSSSSVTSSQTTESDTVMEALSEGQWLLSVLSDGELSHGNGFHWGSQSLNEIRPSQSFGEVGCAQQPVLQESTNVHNSEGVPHDSCSSHGSCSSLHSCSSLYSHLSLTP